MPFTNTARPTEKRSLHFDLSHAESDQVFTLHACLKEYPLHKHTPETLRKFRAQQHFLTLIPDERLTHYSEDLALPSDAIALVYVASQQPINGRNVSRIETMHIHVPRAGRRRAREKMREKRALRGGTPDEAPSVPPKFVPFGVTAESFPASVSASDASADPIPEEIDDAQDAYETAYALLFQHRDLLNLNPENDGYYAAWIMDNCIEANPGIGDLAFQIYESAHDGGWCTEVPVLDQQGQQMFGDDGAPIYSQKIAEAVQSAMGGPVQWAVQRAKQAPELEGQSWTVQYGLPASDYNATSTTSDGSSPTAQPNLAMQAVSAAAAPAPFKWTINNLSPSHGLTVASHSLKYTPPPTSDIWTATNIWSDQDEGFPLTPALADQMLAGELTVKIVTADHPQGLVGAKLTPGIVEEDELVDFGDVNLSGDQLSPPVETQVAATGTFSLNGSRTGLSFKITLTGNEDDASLTLSFSDSTGSVVSPPFVVTNMSDYGVLSIDCTNHWLRHLGAYVQFLDDANNVITPSPWNNLLPDSVQSSFQPNDSKKFLGIVLPVSTLCGIPIKAFPTTLEIPVPDNAHTVRLLWGGLGKGKYDADICSVGIGLTVALELALPIFFLAAAAAPTDTLQLNELLADSAVMFQVLRVTDSVVEGCVDQTMTEQDAERMLIAIADTLGPMLLETGLKWFITKVLAEAAVEKTLPFVDLAFQTFNVGVDMAMLAQTTNEVLQSPFYYETKISKSVDLSIRLMPDPVFKFFPPLATHYEVKVLYASNASYPVFDDSYQLENTTQSDPVTVNFSSAPAGGELKVYAMFYADNGWVAGMGETAWIEAKGNATNPDGSALLKIDNLVIKNFEVPLDAHSVYTHKQKLSYQKFDAQGHASPDGTYQHGWLSSPAPTATPASPPPKEGHAITRLSGLTLSQSPTQLAYAWEASGLHVHVNSPVNPISDDPVGTLQNITVLQRPQEAYAVPEVGFSGKANVAYDIASPDDGTGMNFFIDTTSGSGYHLRRLSLVCPPPDKDGIYHPQPPRFTTATNESWGCFQLENDRYIYHPKGYVIGISMALSKLEILKIPALPSADNEAPQATLALGDSGDDARYGLINSPVALGAALDGRLLVLESKNNRVQAFDVDGVPVACFSITEQNPPPPGVTPDPSGFQSTMALIDEKGSVKYLDLAVESKGYLYILSHTDDGSQAWQYKVDIYNPDGSFLVTTPGVAAGALTVDLLRDLYTLNYEVILGENDRTEPSVSMWIPPAPSTTQSLSGRRSSLDYLRRR